MNMIERREEIDKARAFVGDFGATVLEDKLEEGVPEAIELLLYIGIKLWILTGVFGL